MQRGYRWQINVPTISSSRHTHQIPPTPHYSFTGAQVHPFTYPTLRFYFGTLETAPRICRVLTKIVSQLLQISVRIFS